MILAGRRIHIVGSADPEADEGKLNYVHAFVAELVSTLAADAPRLLFHLAKNRSSKTGRTDLLLFSIGQLPSRCIVP